MTAVTHLRSVAHTIVPELLVDLARSRQSFYRRWAFHGDRVYQSLIVELIEQLGLTHFVETGTYLGDSSRFVAERQPQLPILTSEVDAQVYERARRRLRRYPQVELVNDSSTQVLRRYFEQAPENARPLFFLDAHWYDYWPLADELEVISTGRGQAVVVVDDFQVPGRPEFAFDSYIPRDAAPNAAPVVCGSDYVEAALAQANEYRILTPNYTYADGFAKVGERTLAGHAVVLQNMSSEIDGLLAGSPSISRNYNLDTLHAQRV